MCPVSKDMNTVTKWNQKNHWKLSSSFPNFPFWATHYIMFALSVGVLCQISQISKQANTKVLLAPREESLNSKGQHM